jgi:hypothetical protein
MILQVEDCIDCLRILCNDQYHHAFLLDHSSGHAKKRVGGLDIGAMNKGFGGEHLRGTLIENKEGYLGLYHSSNNSRMIQVGQVQELVYPAEESITEMGRSILLLHRRKPQGSTLRWNSLCKK